MLCCQHDNKDKGADCSCACHCPVKMAIKILAGLLLVALIVYVGVLVRNGLKNYHYIGKAIQQQNTIAISGEGKITGTPTIAMTEIGLLTDKKDVASAQKENTDKMNKLIAAVKALGIPESDIQTTQYQIYPKYDYTNGKSVISGYTVNQSITLKIRDLTKISAVLSKVGEVGANQVSNLTFTIDEPENLRAEARAKALASARGKADDLAKALGVKLVRVVSFSENNAEPMPPIYYRSANALGGAGDAVTTPSIQTGTLDVTVDVNVIYEIE